MGCRAPARARAVLTDRAAELADCHGPFDGVVVSVASWGGQGRKPALSLTDSEWDHLLASNLTAVFRLYREFVPTSRAAVPWCN